jgi:Mg2+ and Co2+ transporter CorA
MEVLWVSEEGLARHNEGDLPALLARDDGFVWIDLPSCDDDAARVLSETFGFHAMALRDCLRRSHVPKLRAYRDHVFVILHAPERGEGGHVHLLELDQFVGHRYLVTVHGPLGHGVTTESATRDTQAIMSRIESGRLRPRSPAELSHAIVSRMALGLEEYVAALAGEIAILEVRVRQGASEHPEDLLEELFVVRHELLTIRTMAAQSREAYARMVTLSRYLPEAGRDLAQDLVDQFERVAGLCEQEKDFIQGVADYYQSRISTKINIAAERLALIAAILLPISAISGIYGMNLIVNRQSQVWHIGLVLGLMAVVTAIMLRWTKKHGWW